MNFWHKSPSNDETEGNTPSLASSENITSFNEVITVPKQAQQVWKSSQPLSRLRDQWEGHVHQTNGEYKLVTSEEEPNAHLTTLFRGDYVPGFEFEWGMGVRIAQFPTSDGEIRIGYLEYETGFYLAIQESNTELVWKTQGEIQEVVEQANWNQDTLDGSGSERNPSGARLDFTKGTIVQGRLVYYGYGFMAIYFGVRDSKNNFRMVKAHVFGQREGVSLDTSNLFLTMSLVQGAGEPIEAYVGGRQMSLLGENTGQFRIIGEHRTREDITTEWTPMVSVQPKQSLVEVVTHLFNVEVISKANLVVGIFINSDLDENAVFRESSVGHSEETVSLFDTSAETMDMSESFVFSGMTLVPGESSGSARILQEQLATKRLPEQSVVTVAVRQVDAETEAKATLVMNIQEQW